MIESILLAITQISTFEYNNILTRATGFFFERNKKLFLITNRHVFKDEFSHHFPNRIEISLHNDPNNLASTTQFSIPLYKENMSLWHEVFDSEGLVDVCAIEMERDKLPKNILIEIFTPENLLKNLEIVEVGTSVLAIGFPLGFQDFLHCLPVARHAIIASSFGLRFNGKGYFLTDAPMHRGASGSPIVMRMPNQQAGRNHFSWILLGIHSSRIDVNRDEKQDERLNLNCAWYADALIPLTTNHAKRENLLLCAPSNSEELFVSSPNSIATQIFSL